MACISRLDILYAQFPDVQIPQDVWDELIVAKDFNEFSHIQQAVELQQIKIQKLTNIALKQSFMLVLDKGEAAAIALAIESGIKDIIIDENEGRKVAKAMGLRPIGVLGILLLAKKQRKIHSLTDEMLRLKDISGFFIADTLFQKFQKEAGE
jgi:hypothetical protein